MGDADYNAKEPIHPISIGGAISIGLTKREYFAGLAMQGLLANNLAPISLTQDPVTAVEMADALIAALAEKGAAGDVQES